MVLTWAALGGSEQRGAVNEAGAVDGGRSNAAAKHFRQVSGRAPNQYKATRIDFFVPNDLQIVLGRAAANTAGCIVSRAMTKALPSIPRPKPCNNAATSVGANPGDGQPRALRRTLFVGFWVDQLIQGRGAQRAQLGLAAMPDKYRILIFQPHAEPLPWAHTAHLDAFTPTGINDLRRQFAG